MENKTQNYPLIATLIFVFSLVFPLLLLPVEKVLPYPYILEELSKAILIILILRIPSKNFQIKLAVFSAFLFAFSENFFYLATFIENGNLNLFLQRFILTSILHIITALIILLLSQKNSRLFFPAVFIAMLFHFFYNYAILFLS